VTIETRKGQLLAAFTTPLPIPEVTPPPRSQVMGKPDAELTLQELCLKARKYDLATNRKKAREYYEKVLAQDAGSAAALRGLAVLDFEAGLYGNAVRRLNKALERDPDDGLAWYFLGVSHLRLQNEREALRCARQGALCLGTRALAYDLAGRAHMALGETSEAVAAFRKATELNPKDSKARDHWLLALYAAGEMRSVFRNAEDVSDRHPTDLVPRAILALRGEKQMERFARETRDFVGEDDFEMLETCLTFAQMGLTKEAGQLLSAVCTDEIPLAQRSGLPLYYLAYFASLRDEPATAQVYLKRAAKTIKDYVFPSRPEALDVLKYAVRENPNDAQAHLHIGNLYAHLGRVSEAADHWRKAVRLDSALSIAHRNLGLYALTIDDDAAQAEQAYRQAVKARPKDQTLYRDLAEILMVQDKRPEAIGVLESTPFEKLRRADIIIMLAQAYLDEQRYGDAIDLLESTPYFVNWEGQTVTWNLFSRSHIKRGQERFAAKDFRGALKDFEAALTYPENIGVGRSNEPQEATAQYWRGKALLALGRTEAAHTAWKRGAAGVEGSDEQNTHRELCRTALEKTK